MRLARQEPGEKTIGCSIEKRPLSEAERKRHRERAKDREKKGLKVRRGGVWVEGEGKWKGEEDGGRKEGIKGRRERSRKESKKERERRRKERKKEREVRKGGGKKKRGKKEGRKKRKKQRW
jgi:hypothetical protein